MLLRILFIWLTTSFALFPPLLAAGDKHLSVEILTTFDYPDAHSFTATAEINNLGDVAGFYSDAIGLERGFVRYRNGSFSPPIIPPGTGDFTGANDINDERTVCGFFFDNANQFIHSYFLSGTTFTQFDIAGANSTTVSTLNNAGAFAGSFDSNGQTQAFVDIAGEITPFSIPGASLTSVTSINRQTQTIGIYRLGTETINHGFRRDEFGNLTFPIDFPGSAGPIGTILAGFNDSGWIVGSYSGRDTVQHGFILKGTDRLLSYDYPGALYTKFSGINNNELICGWYLDSVTGAVRGLIARLR